MEGDILEQKTDTEIHEREIVNDIHERVLKALMNIGILAALMKRNSMSSYDFLAYFHRKTSVHIGYSLIYSRLYVMERDNLITSVEIQRKRVYNLTNKGERTLRIALNMTDEIQRFIKDLKKQSPYVGLLFET